MTGRYARGDLVELRDEAEKGMVHLFEVKQVSGSGGLLLGQRSDVSKGFMGIDTFVAAEEVAEEVFTARPHVLAAYGRS